ncbi:hypothetical protein MHYP_G00093120 [Metynnis hypsauchen]
MECWTGGVVSGIGFQPRKSKLQYGAKGQEVAVSIAVKGDAELVHEHPNNRAVARGPRRSGHLLLHCRFCVVSEICCYTLFYSTTARQKPRRSAKPIRLRSRFCMMRPLERSGYKHCVLETRSKYTSQFHSCLPKGPLQHYCCPVLKGEKSSVTEKMTRKSSVHSLYVSHWSSA